jgi:hypothetical protein
MNDINDINDIIKVRAETEAERPNGPNRGACWKEGYKAGYLAMVSDVKELLTNLEHYTKGMWNPTIDIENFKNKHGIK